MMHVQFPITIGTVPFRIPSMPSPQMMYGTYNLNVHLPAHYSSIPGSDILTCIKLYQTNIVNNKLHRVNYHAKTLDFGCSLFMRKIFDNILVKFVIINTVLHR